MTAVLTCSAFPGVRSSSEFYSSVVQIQVAEKRKWIANISHCIAFNVASPEQVNREKKNWLVPTNCIRFISNGRQETTEYSHGLNVRS